MIRIKPIWSAELAVSETPPQDFGRGRCCEKCEGPVSRYQTPCRGEAVEALLCNYCQNQRLKLGIPLRQFVSKARVLSGGQKKGYPLPGLKTILDSRKMASWELSEASGVSRRFVEDLRAGRKNASDECALKLASALLGVSEPPEVSTGGRPLATKLPGLGSIRRSFGLSVPGFARESGVVATSIYRIEAGAGAAPESLARIQQAVVRLMRGHVPGVCSA